MSHPPNGEKRIERDLKMMGRNLGHTEIHLANRKNKLLKRVYCSEVF